MRVRVKYAVMLYIMGKVGVFSRNRRAREADEFKRRNLFVRRRGRICLEECDVDMLIVNYYKFYNEILGYHMIRANSLFLIKRKY